MNTGFAFITILSLLILSSCVSGQDGRTKTANKTPDFSGTWVIDISKSKLDPGERYESMTLTVSQTVTEVRVETVARLLPADPAFMDGPMKRTLDRNTSNTYSLEQKETRGEMAGPAGPMPATLTASLDEGKLRLRQALTSDAPVPLNETWTLSPDGKTLTVERDRGGSCSLLVFNKKL